jgi:chromosome segregation ATPase
VEEHFKLETKDYLTTIKRLQEENRKLSSSLTAATERDSGVSEDESYIEIDLVHKLQGTVEKQREQIRDLDSELSNVKADLEELKGQNDRLSTSNKELRRKLRQSQNQLHCLVDERAELQVTLQDQQRETSLLAKRLGLAAKENQDLAECATAEPDMKGKVVYEVDDPNRPRFTLMELKDILQERNTLKGL